MPRPTLALADDDELHSELVATWLEHHGYDVLRFGSGDDLVNWATSTSGGVDAFVLDIDMPGRDGFESCRDLKSIPTYSATPAVFVSSLVCDMIGDRVSSVGGNHMVCKDAEMLPRLTSWLSENVLVEA